jgi:hypothetical protein
VEASSARPAERRTFAQLAPVTPDGPAVWIDYDADAGQPLVDTARGRRTERNVRATPTVGVGTLDPEEPDRFVSVRGGSSR